MKINAQILNKIRKYKALLIMVAFLLTIGCLFLLGVASSNAKLSDIFTTDRISTLKNRPPEFTRDVVVDLSLCTNKGGVKTLTENIIVGIAQKKPNWRIIAILSDHSNQDYYKLKKFRNIKLVNVKIQYDPFKNIIFSIVNLLTFNAFKLLFDQIVFFNEIIIDNKCDLYWKKDATSSILEFPHHKVSTVHDLIFIEASPAKKSNSTRFRGNLIEKCVLNDDKIITVSNFSKRRILETFHIPENRLKMIHIKLAKRIHKPIPLKRQIDILNKYNLEKDKYLIFISVFWENKNHVALIRAFAKFLKQTGSDMKLVLAGSCPIGYGKFKDVAVVNKIEDRVIFTDYVSNEDLQSLLSNAHAFICPSIYEGFGMPIIEALEAGIPVACSNRASLPEVAGDAAVFFDPQNQDEMIQAMIKITSDNQLREKLRLLGYKQAEKFNDTDFMINEYVETFEEVMRK
ncbi:MAG: glycosyltransferase family 4 protein [Holosporaceae bacterium]|jgi:glycosyltransferase involved in cell wall biosynthesis|nr:glycosyltransferase family 4 protein [Holosporaceae bacterium]